MILKTLKTAVDVCGPNLGFKSNDVSARSLCAAGAMSLLCSRVDSVIIKMIGIWRSDETLMYLHVQADTTMKSLLRLMLTNGNYYFLPHQEEVPCF